MLPLETSFSTKYGSKYKESCHYFSPQLISAVTFYRKMFFWNRFHRWSTFFILFNPFSYGGEVKTPPQLFFCRKPAKMNFNVWFLLTITTYLCQILKIRSLQHPKTCNYSYKLFNIHKTFMRHSNYIQVTLIIYTVKKISRMVMQVSKKVKIVTDLWPFEFWAISQRINKNC